MESTEKKLTADELDAVLRKKDLAACRDFFLCVPEKDRKPLAARALEWFEIASAYEAVASPFVRAMMGFESELPKRTQQQLALTKKVDKGEIVIPSEVKAKESIAVARLAVSACGTLTEIRRCGMPPHEFAFEVMRDRNPKWMGKWLDFACERGLNSWTIIRAIERHGTATAERGDFYFTAMAYSLGQKNVVDLADFIRQDDEVQATLLWEMLSNDAAIKLLTDPGSVNDQFRRLNARNVAGTDWSQLGIRLEDSNRSAFNWRLVLIDLATKNEISKSRLLDLTFEWLARLSGDEDSKPTVGLITNTTPTEWFQQLHDEMNLSTNEKNSFAIRYISLLSVRDVATLAWSVRNLSLCALSSLPLDDLFANLPRVFYHKKKEPSLAALQLIDQFLKEDADLLVPCTEVVIEAFEHPSSEVQKKALSFLKKTKAFNSPSVAAQLETKLERLSALMRKELADLLKTSPSGASSASKDISLDPAATNVLPSHDNVIQFSQSAAPIESSTREELLALINDARPLLGVLAEAAGIPDAVKAAEERRLPTALRLKSLEIPRLEANKRIKPVETLDELIFLFLHVVERTSSTDDGERLLDGLSRLHHLHPPEFDSMVSSLKKKLESFWPLIGRMGENAPVPYYAKLAHSWLKVKEPKEGFAFLKQIGDAFSEAMFSPVFTNLMEGVPPNVFLLERANAIVRTIKKGKPLPLLAAPTHSGGWIDPRALPLRLSAWRQAGILPELADIVQCLLRLAPEHRTEALKEIALNKDEHIRAIRWALGGDLNGDTQTAELWVAAFRCREPEGTSELLKNKFRNLGPDSAQAATYIDRTEDYAKRESSIYGTSFQVSNRNTSPIGVSPPPRKGTETKMFPTELMHVNSVFFEAEPMMELYYPLCRESFFANQANRTATFLTSSGTYWASEWNALFDSDVSLSGMGTWMLVIGLSAKQSEAARLALDATICGIEETRLDGENFGFIMARFLRTGWITLSRWMTAFKDITRISPLHTEFCFQALQNCLANLGDDYKSKPPVPMIEALYDSAQAARSRISKQECREFLGGIQSKGKAAKLAKLLLELDDSGRAEHIDAVNLQILQSRMDRIERWKGRMM